MKMVTVRRLCEVKMVTVKNTVNIVTVKITVCSEDCYSEEDRVQ